MLGITGKARITHRTSAIMVRVTAAIHQDTVTTAAERIVVVSELVDIVAVSEVDMVTADTVEVMAVITAILPCTLTSDRFILV